MQENSGFLRLEKKELDEIKNLYETVMNVASHGLFFRAGKIIGKRYVENGFEEDYYPSVSNAMVSENWAGNIEFNGGSVRVDNSIEVLNGKGECTCHMLRGVLSTVIENKRGKCTVREIACQSQGDESCIFEIGGGPR